jgi:nicotinamide mononucleotide (NMN) deamidase PncC
MSDRARKLHDSPWQGVFYMTGGGISLLGEMLGAAGASRTVLDARVPYAAEALSEMLGTAPEQACSDATARGMAMNAFQQARRLSARGGAAEPFGLGCTASLATDRIKRGEHRAHAAIQTRDATFTAHWTFDADRNEEESLLTEHLWSKLGQALGIKGVGESIEIRHTEGRPAWQALILGERQALATSDHDGMLLIPGAFNPLHEGHRQMLTIAEELTELDGAYELSVANVDKPFLDYREIEARLAQFDRPVWLTRLPTFLEKARQFRNATFVVGLDTLLRIAEPRYYGTEGMRDEALTELAEFGASYLVFGRTIDGTFTVLSDVEKDLPAILVERATEIDADRFNNPISSTGLRHTPD